MIKNNRFFFISLLSCYLVSLVFKVNGNNVLPRFLYISLIVLSAGLSIFIYLRNENIRSDRKKMISLLLSEIMVIGLLTVYGNYPANDKTGSIITCFLLMSLSIVYCINLNEKYDKKDRLLILLFLFGIIIRFTYISYTDWNMRQHDIGNLVEGHGHSGYMLYLLNNKHLPDFDPTSVWQFYHPPLHHFLAAVWMFLHQIFGFETEAMLESVQFLTMFYSILCIKLFYDILEEFNVNKTGKVIASALFAFCPELIYISAQLNNDLLSFVFILLIFLWTIRWIKDASMRNIIPIALSFGFGMMTKLSVAIMAFPVGIMFVYKFFTCLKEKENLMRLLKQYAVFLIICAPIGLWWSIRNMLMWNMPLSYVPSLGNDSWQYIGFVNPLSRLIHPKFSSIFVDKDPIDFNMILALFKTWVFEELDFKSNPLHVFICYPLFITNVIIILMAIFEYFRSFKNISKEYLFMNLTIIISMISYIYFCYSFPHLCTMHIRYVLILIPTVYILFVRNYKVVDNKIDIFKELLVLINTVSSFLMFILIV